MIDNMVKKLEDLFSDLHLYFETVELNDSETSQIKEHVDDVEMELTRYLNEI